jgi:predicted amidohydrolase YtcJ
MTRIRFYWLVVLLLLHSEDPGSVAAQDRGDLVVLNAKVVTLDKDSRLAEAFAVRDGKFVAVGSNTEIRGWVGPQTRAIDAHGKTIVPGIIESHSHASGVAQAEASEPYQEMTSIVTIQEWVRRAAQKKPEGEWIVIPRSYPSRLRERRFPTRAELDGATTRHPVVFDGAYSHVLNSLALQKAGIRRDSSPLAVGEIVRDATGEPTGLLRNARGLLRKFLPAPKVSNEEVLNSLEKLHQIYASLGITSMMERAGSLEDYRKYDELRAQNRLKLRTRFTLRLPGTTAAEAEKFIRNLPLKPCDGDEWLAPGPLKITVDGGILLGTAYMRESYGSKAVALYSLTDPSYRGSLSLEPGSITALITTGHRLGWQMSAHVTGNAGVDLVLDAVEAAGKIRPIEKSRFNLIHAYFPDAATTARARKLGVCLDTQPAWYFKDADALVTALGSERLSKFVGVREWLKAGVPVAANTDHMLGMDPNRALNPFNPFLTMYVLVTRKTEGGQVIGAGQKVSREEALRMMTRDAAYLTFDEDKKGSIEAGKFADFAILSDDYLSCPPEKIRNIHADTTFVAGRIIYERKPAP